MTVDARDQVLWEIAEAMKALDLLSFDYWATEAGREEFAHLINLDNPDPLDFPPGTRAAERQIVEAYRHLKRAMVSCLAWGTQPTEHGGSDGKKTSDGQ